MLINFHDKISAALARQAYEAKWVLPLLRKLIAFVDVAWRHSNFAFPGDTAVDEIRAKIHAFGCFRCPDRWTEGTYRHVQDWLNCVETVELQDPLSSIWLLEGWAARLTDGQLRESSFPFLTGCGAGKGLKPGSRMVLHTGAGMSLARFMLPAGRAWGRSRPLSEVISEFLAVAAERAMPNFRNCIVEPLGLVVRTLHPQCTLDVSRLLSARSCEDCGLFWHGSGRGLYFTPLQLVPCLRWRYWALDEAASNAPDDSMRANLVSGFFWAMTLVNIRSPGVVATFLDGRAIECWEPFSAAISDGVSAALLAWHCLTGDEAVINHFLDYAPHWAIEGLPRFWDERIVSFFRRRSKHEYERLVREDSIAELFRFRGQEPLPATVC